MTVAKYGMFPQKRMKGGFMKDNHELMLMVEEQEKRYIFDEFYAETALKIGNSLIEEAKDRRNKIAIDIFAFGRCLFHYSSNGNEPSNDEMIRRKRNLAQYTGHASLWSYYFLADICMTIDEKWNLDPSEYAPVGGSFPIRVANCGGPIGVITVSGFEHTLNHAIIIDVLEKEIDI